MLVWNGITKNFKLFLPSIGLWIILAGIYSYLAPLTPTGIADSDELVSLGFGLKAAHPPGYAMLMGLIYGITHFPVPLSVFGRANLLNAAIMALAVVFWYESIKLLVAKNKIKSYKIISWFVALMLGLTLPLLVYGSITEVLALLLCLSIIAWFFALKVYETCEHKWWYRWCVVTMLVGLHHQLGLLIIPGMIVLLFPFWQDLVKKRQFRPMGIGVGLMLTTFLMMNLLLELELSRQFGWHWQHAEGLAGMWQYWSRDIYTGVNVEARGVIRGVFTPGVWQSLWPNFIDYLINFVKVQVTPIGLIVAFLGIMYAKHKLPKFVFLAILCNWIISALFLGAYLNIPTNESQTRLISERMFTPGLVWWFFYLSFGMWFLYEKLKNKWVKRFSLMLIGFILIRASITNIYEVKLIKSTAWWPTIEASLGALPQGARVLCLGDVSCFSMMAWQEVYKPDRQIEVIPITSNLQTGTDLTQLPYGYPDNPFRLDEVIGQAKEKAQPVYYFENSQFYNQHWQINQGGWKTDEATLIKPIVCDENRTIANQWNGIEVQGSSIIQRWRRDWLRDQVQRVGQDKPCLSAAEHYQLAIKCQNSNQHGCALREALSAVQHSPTDWSYRMKLAQIMEAAELLPLAKREYRIIKEIHPNEKGLNEALLRLENIEDLPLHQLVFTEPDDN